MRWNLLLISLIATMAGCAWPSEEPLGATCQPIVGGREAAPGDWPSVAWLSGGCSATLLDPYRVLSAAHCGTDHGNVYFGTRVELDLDLDAGEARVVGGDYRASAIDSCVPHPEARIGGGNDLIVCFLEEPVFEIATLPLLSPLERSRLAEGDAVTVVGFGFEQPDGTPGLKRWATTSVVALEQEIVIGDDSTGTCRGDSGGPAFLNVAPEADTAEWRQLGVLSSGASGACGAGRYTDVALLNAWVEQATAHPNARCP